MTTPREDAVKDPPGGEAPEVDPAGVDPPDFVDEGGVLDSEWEDPPPRTGTLTKVLAALLLVALGFFAGVAVGRAAGGVAPSGNVSAGPAGGGGGGGGSGSGTSGSGTSGGSSGSGVSQAAVPSAGNQPDVGGGTRTSSAAPVTQSPIRPVPANQGGSAATSQAGSGTGFGTAANGTGVGSSGSGSSPTTVSSGSGSSPTSGSGSSPPSMSARSG